MKALASSMSSRTSPSQIGDACGPNGLEARVEPGPLRQLPAGYQLVEVLLDQYDQGLRVSTTDRRDFYHQAKVSVERSDRNIIGCPRPVSNFGDDDFPSQPRRRLPERLLASGSGPRASIGDLLSLATQERVAAKARKKGLHVEAANGSLKVYGAFRSLFMGDHLGVEYA